MNTQTNAPSFIRLPASVIYSEHHLLQEHFHPSSYKNCIFLWAQRQYLMHTEILFSPYFPSFSHIILLFSLFSYHIFLFLMYFLPKGGGHFLSSCQCRIHSSVNVGSFAWILWYWPTEVLYMLKFCMDFMVPGTDLPNSMYTGKAIFYCSNHYWTEEERRVWLCKNSYGTVHMVLHRLYRYMCTNRSSIHPPMCR